MYDYYVNAKIRKSKISREIYGHFSEHLGRCIYNGIYVGKGSPISNTNGMRNDVVKALKYIQVPVLRWPGGCFADEYHWRDGIGPLQARKKMINTNWGGVVEDNSFGTHEFFELCAQLGCEPYITGNVGSGTVAEMQEWVEYMTFDGVSPMAELRRKNGREAPWRLKYFGLGNESWGCGGNMTAEYYSNEYRRYQSFVKNYNGNEIFKIACGPNADNYEWTDTLMRNASEFINGLSLHYYTLPTGDWFHKGSATEFDDQTYYETLRQTLRMEELLTRHDAVMTRYDPQKRVALIVDEWGTWFDIEPGTNPGFLYQQNTMRDAIVAGINLNLFNKHSDRVRMTNIAQVVNVLQSLILTEGDKMLLTPTYHVFDLYKDHQDATLIESHVECPCVMTDKTDLWQVHESASVDDDGTVHLTLCNLSLIQTADIRLHLTGTAGKDVSARILKADPRAHNTFESPETVIPMAFDRITALAEGQYSFVLPACSVLHAAIG